MHVEFIPRHGTRAMFDVKNFVSWQALLVLWCPSTNLCSTAMWSSSSLSSGPREYQVSVLLLDNLHLASGLFTAIFIDFLLSF